MRIEVASLLLALVVGFLTLTGCQSRGDKPNEVETVKVIYRDRLVPAPCPETVTRPADVLRTFNGSVPEDYVDAIILSDSVWRQYVPSLEAAAMACGVKIAN